MSEEAPRRRPRLIGLIVLAVIVGLLGFAIVSLSVGTGGEGQIQITGAEETQSLLGGIQQDGARLGPGDAPVTVQVFNDLQCDPCSDWNHDVTMPLIRGPVRAGQIQMIFHHFPISAESGFFLGSYGAVAAAKQDDEWQFIELFFLNQEEAKKGGANQDFLDNVARAILNFNVEQWQNDMKDSDIEETLKEDESLAAQRQLPAEPAVVVGGPNGSRQLEESPTLGQVEAAIAQVR
ncbi:MAG: DsbA family protein [Solirubrobacterales bacterium]|nr:thioredoxin domain-containing protein [Solirubrobacterales bacterium]